MPRLPAALVDSDQQLAPPADTPLLGEADVRIAEVPAQLTEPTWTGPAAQATNRQYLLDLPTIGRFLVEDGCRVTVQPAGSATGQDLESVLSGPVRQVLWLQAGQLALRGAATATAPAAGAPGRALVVAAIGGAGASTIAAALAGAGHRPIADQAVLIEAGTPRAPAVHVLGPQLDLWPDALDKIGLDPGTGESIRPGIGKQRCQFVVDSRCPTGSNGPVSPIPLAAVAILRRYEHRPQVVIERIQGMEAIKQLMAHTAMSNLIVPFGLRRRHFRWATTIASQVEVYQVGIDKHGTSPAAVAEKLGELA